MSRSITPLPIWTAPFACPAAHSLSSRTSTRVNLSADDSSAFSCSMSISLIRVLASLTRAWYPGELVWDWLLVCPQQKTGSDIARRMAENAFIVQVLRVLLCPIRLGFARPVILRRGSAGSALTHRVGEVSHYQGHLFECVARSLGREPAAHTVPSAHHSIVDREHHFLEHPLAVG